MYDYALIIHPTNEELLHKYEPGMKHKPRPLVKKVLEWMSPFEASVVEGLKSNLGRTAKGALVMCPLLMEQMLTLSPSKVMKSVIATMEFAKNLEPKIIGLTAYAAFSGNKGSDLAQVVDLPLTTGTNYTLAMIPETILRAADLMEIDLSSTHILVIGATSNVGRYSIEILSHFVSGMFITAHNEDKLNLLLSELPKEKRNKLHRIRELKPILDKVKIVIIATNRIPAEFEINKLNPGTIIFDASYPRRISSSMRNDILVIDGVAIKPPGDVDFHFDFGLPKGLCYPCMAEPIILALERKFENYSLGKEVNADRIREILRLGAKHGFEISGLTSQERVISHDEILKVKHEALKKRRKISFWR
jgi:predicted amino acid dehydrogenase